MARKLGKPIRKDPAGFKSTELRNARILANLVNDFEELVLKEVDRNTRELAEDYKFVWLAGKSGGMWRKAFLPGSLKNMLDTVAKVEAYIDGGPAIKASESVVVASVAHGRAWADKSLGRFGITTTAPPYTNAKPFYLPPEQRMIDAYSTRIATEIKGLTNYQSTKIQRAITEGFARGETVRQIVTRIKQVTPMAKSKAITIARTETLSAGNAAAKERYAAAGVEKVEWIAALDDRVCEICEGLHEQTFDLGKEPPIPAHPNCRCTLVPYMEKEE